MRAHVTPASLSTVHAGDNPRQILLASAGLLTLPYFQANIVRTNDRM